MPAHDLDELVEQWTIEGHKPLGRVRPGNGGDYERIESDESFKNLLEQLEFYSGKFFSRFIPALYPPHVPLFLERLLNWLNNEGIDPENQRLLFEFALRIVYFSFDDFLQLYRSAYVGPVARWIIDELQLSLNQADFASRLETERRQHTWYCPVTDSMVISEFYHANGITGIDQRPAFRALRRFCDAKLLKAYMTEHGLVRLVLMEDFVGTGTQSREAVRWAVQSLDCPVLYIPMVICPEGVTTFTALVAEFPGRLQFEPLLVLDQSTFVAPQGGTVDAFLARVATLAQAIHPQLVDTPDTTSGPFGYGKDGAPGTGATVVLFSNTPDNTLPLVHHHCRHPSKWNALFPRVSRETL